MSFTSRRKKDLKSFCENDHKDAYVIRIATEGGITEPEYFRSAVMGGRCSRIRVEVLPTKGGFSSLDHVFARLKQSILDDNGLEADQYWIVADMDHYIKTNRMEAFVDSVIDFNARNNLKFQLALSNPKFEVWLALHQRHNLKSQGIINLLASSPETMVREIDDHYKKSFNTRFITHQSVLLAVKQSIALDKNKQQKVPACPGTYVYRLVQEILKVLARSQKS